MFKLNTNPTYFKQPYGWKLYKIDDVDNSRLVASNKANPMLLHLSKLSSVSLAYPCRKSYACPGYFHISKNYSSYRLPM
jgi:hypothetical protein